MVDLPVENLTLSDSSSKEVEPPKTFLSLPNDVLRRIVGKELSKGDRNKIGLINERLRFIEKTAGYRQIEQVDISKSSCLAISTRSPSFNCDGNTPEQDVIDYFYHASIERLEIEVECRLDTEKERKLRAILNTATFKTLAYRITDENSCRILKDLVANRNGLKELALSFLYAEVDEATSTALLLSLPPMDEYLIKSTALPVDDKILLRLVANSSRVDINCSRTDITRKGAVDAFKIVCNQDRPRRVYFPLHREYLGDILETMDVESGATLYIDDWEEDNDYPEVHMFFGPDE